MNPVDRFLPAMVYVVSYCPVNETDWKMASAKLNCSFDTSDNRYHCVPDEKRSALLEFCYDTGKILVKPGNCLELVDSFTLNYYGCSEKFSNGCPDKFFFSDEIYKYPSCTSINTKNQCFTADPKCESHKITTYSTTYRNAIVSDTDYPSSAYGAWIGIGILFFVVIGLIAALRICYIKRRRDKVNYTMKTQEGSCPDFSSGETSKVLEKVDVPNQSINTTEEQPLISGPSENAGKESGVQIDTHLGEVHFHPKPICHIPMPVRVPPVNERIIAALDIGSAYSGFSFSSYDDLSKVPPVIHGRQWKSSMEQLISPKTPTTVLLNEDGEFHSFGYEAERCYSDIAEELKHTKYFLFKRFKMEIKKYEKTLAYETELTDITGRKLQALRVLKLSIAYLKEEMIKELRRQLKFTHEECIFWVLTVPNWTVPEKKFMQEAASLAGIEDSKLLITDEAKAVSMYCKYLPLQLTINEGKGIFVAGTRYIVLDAGGGTVDITAIEVQNDSDVKKLESRHGPFGGNTVDDRFQCFFEDIVGKKNLEDYARKYAADYIELFNAFELLKRNYHTIYEASDHQQTDMKTDTDYLKHKTLYIPRTFLDSFENATGQSLEERIKSSEHANSVKLSRERMRIDKGKFNSFYDYAHAGIVGLVHQILKCETVKNTDLIVMVGGFSESKLLQTKLQESFPTHRFIIPDDPGLAVLKGGVLFGHDNPHSFNIGKFLRRN